jgi:drug/metabolite transporter (DMT)-like permease
VTVAVMSAALPVVGIALECLLDGRRLTGALIAGLALSLAGGLVTYGARLGDLNVGLGAGVALLSLVAYAWASCATVKTLPGLTPIGATALTLLGGALATALAWGAATPVLGAGIDHQGFGAAEAGLLALYGLGSLALSQVFWILAVGRLGVGVAAMHINAAPFYVMAIAALTGGAWGWPQAAGAAIVGAGVLVAQGPGRRA